MKVLGAGLHVLVVLAWLVPAEGAPPFTVTADRAQLSVTARSAPLDQILVEIGRQSGVEIKIESGLEDSVTKETTTVEFSGLSIEEGLGRLLRQKNMILLYDPAGLSEVRIYVNGTGAFQTVKAQGTQAMTPGRREPERPNLAELAARLDAMAAAGDEEGTVRAAVEVLERERDPETRETALSALGGLESVPVDPLLRVAETEGDPDLKIQALQLLIEHGRSDPRVSALLTKLTKESDSTEVREAAESLLEDLQEDLQSASPVPAVAGPAPPGAKTPPAPRRR